jgi:hypothetical protein
VAYRANTRFEQIEVELDGNTFEQCVFLYCDLVYRGGTVPEFSGCLFDGCQFLPTDAAIRTIGVLSVLKQAGVGDLVDDLLKTFLEERIGSGATIQPTGINTLEGPKVAVNRKDERSN